MKMMDDKMKAMLNSAATLEGFYNAHDAGYDFLIEDGRTVGYEYNEEERNDERSNH